MSIQERYQHGTSLLHEFDPRVKTVVTFTLIIGIVLTPEYAWPAYPLLWALLGSLAEIAQLKALRVSRMAVVALPFALAALTLTFTTPGHEVFTIAGLAVTDAGVARFVAVALKSWLATQAALILAMTTPFSDLLWALSSLRLPDTLVMILGFTYRYLFTLAEEAERLLRARAARSATTPALKAGGNLLWRARVAGAMVGSLFVRSYERSERVYLAMCARGYNGQSRMLHPPALTLRTCVTGAIPVVLLLVIELLALTLWRF
ncbi:MAG: cobalt ECF transporter T component CbiQ [Anaerolineae bacterium]|nr:cobalt ECF transporter T component CbiQ [Anaerolineae bacterium]